MFTEKVGVRVDQLDIDAKAASDMGVSYGKYMANHKGKAKAVETPQKEEKPEKVRLCVVCQERIPPNAHGKAKTCSPACADERRRQQQKKTNLRRRQQKLQEEELIL